MAPDDLTALLLRLRDDVATEAECVRARALAAQDDRIPPEVRDGLFHDDPSGDAAGLLAVLGEDAAFARALARAIEVEAGPHPEVPVSDGWAEVAGEVIAALGGEALPPVADAVRDEAGEADVVDAVLTALGEPPLGLADLLTADAGPVDVADAVMDAVDVFGSGAWASALLDNELSPADRVRAVALVEERPALGTRLTDYAQLGHDLRDAIAAEAGPVDTWHAVAHAIGIAEPEAVPGYDGALVAEAVRAEAGEVDVARDVMARVRRGALGRAPEVPRAANTLRWLQAGIVLAAMAVIAVIAGNQLTDAPAPKAYAMHFASAGEITVDALDYDDSTTVSVFQAEGDNAPLIIWVDEHEEATL